MIARFAFLFLLFAVPAQAADAMVLSCIPAKGDGPVKIDVYLDAFAHGEFPPKALESVRVLTRFGEDVYEFHPEQVKEGAIRSGVLRIHLFQPLSAGQSAEMRFEGKIGATKGEAFPVEFTIRNERRNGRGTARCTIE